MDATDANTEVLESLDCGSVSFDDGFTPVEVNFELPIQLDDVLECNSMSIAKDPLPFNTHRWRIRNSRRVPISVHKRGFHWRKHHLDMDYWTQYSRKRPSPYLGDAYQKVALNILNSSQPYPGDTMPAGRVLHDRF